MPKFKPKTSKTIMVDKKSTITVDSKHNELLHKFNENIKTIPTLELEMQTLLDKVNRKDYASIDGKLEYIDNIKSLKKKIVKIKKRKKNYFLNNSKYIFEYFENKKNISKNTNKKTLLNNFFKNNKAKNINNDLQMNNVKKYLINVDEQFLDINDYIENHDYCDTCEGELIPIDYEGVLVCNKCSTQMAFLVEHEKPSYKEPPKEICFYAYKRINHFREILAQFQAKESTLIDETIIEDIKNQIKKERITLDQLTNDKTKQILKNLGYNKYYEHIPFIKDKLGIKPPTMNVELETTLCNLFLEIQKPYAKYCPNQRVNFLNYYYVLFKMCELLGKDQYLKHFYMLKDPIKRMEQDEIWKKICAELNWEFIPTP
jgi:hypothetical protein